MFSLSRHNSGWLQRCIHMSERTGHSVHNCNVHSHPWTLISNWFENEQFSGLGEWLICALQVTWKTIISCVEKIQVGLRHLYTEAKKTQQFIVHVAGWAVEFDLLLKPLLCGESLRKLNFVKWVKAALLIRAVAVFTPRKMSWFRRKKCDSQPRRLS